MNQENDISALNEAIQKNPNDVDGYARRADYYFNVSDFDNAIADYTKASELEPDNPKYYLWLSKCYGKKDDFDKNQENVQAALKYKPENVDVAQWITETMHGKPQKDNHEEVMAELQKLVNTGMGALQRGSKDLAIMIYTKALQLAMDTKSISDNVIGKIFYMRGVGFMENEEYERAIDDFSQAVLINPQNIDAYLQRTVCHANMGNKEQVLADLDAASKIDPNHEAVIRYLKAFKGSE